MVVPVVPARMEKTAVLALGHLARAPRGTARIYFTVRARRSLARCPQPLAAVLVADLAALHSLARPTRARLRLSDRPPFPPRLTGAFPILGRRCPPTDPPFFFPPLTGVPRSPVPSPYSAVLPPRYQLNPPRQNYARPGGADGRTLPPPGLPQPKLPSRDKCPDTSKEPALFGA